MPELEKLHDNSEVEQSPLHTTTSRENYRKLTA